MSRLPRPAFPALAVALLLWPPAPARADVFVLLTGDRITGKPVLEGKRNITVQTPFGRLVIPRARIERIIRPDGSQEVLNRAPMEPAASPIPVSGPPAPRSRLVLVIQGQTFFQAWNPKDTTHVDPSLRLEVRIDEESVASWVDAKTDPDLPGAVVNSFSFAPTDVSAFAGPGVELAPPRVQPGRVELRLSLAPESGRRKLRLAYQANEGDKDRPSWRDLAQAAADVDLHPDAPTIIQVRQDRGQMEFSGFPRRRMKNVETFRIELQPE